MKNVDISIVVPIYNAELYLEETLESVFEQTFKNYELLLINDGSTDKSEIICKSYLKKDTRAYYFYKNNSGVSDTRNFGISVAKGKYICFIDSDDILDKDYLKDFIDIFNKNTVEMCCCKFKTFKNQNELSFNNLDDEFYHEYNGINNYDIIFSDYSGYLWNKMFITSIIKENGIVFDRNVGMMEDMLFVFQYLEFVKNSICIEKKNYLYRVTNNSASKKLTNINWFSLFKALDYMLNNRNLYSNKIYNILCFYYLFYLCNAKFRLKYIKNNNEYTSIASDLKERNEKFKELYKYLNLKQKIKIFIYKNFNYISFKMKMFKDN